MSKQTIRVRLSPKAKTIVDLLSEQGASKQDLISASINAIKFNHIVEAFQGEGYVKQLSENCRQTPKKTLGITPEARNKLDEIKRKITIREIKANLNAIVSYAISTHIRAILNDYERNKKIEDEIQTRLKKIAPDVMEISSLWYERTANHENPDEVEGDEGMKYFIEGFYQIYKG
ncbi:hypothetical protein [Pseudodesulfovibrio tunisiensis]|uniref:hypothetical protein n=1 Tax=Pseudodesulfovibrio tunisiensis TaxID=463192 RepID=UPI001FB45A7C|nr:hypothetical protein [Pseudodesulfovibrio tunisiensis]